MKLKIAKPGKVGFWGTPMPGMLDARPAGDDCEEERFALTVDSCNATSAGSLYRFLKRTVADLVLCQEHHLPPRDIAGASTRLRCMGWQSMWLPAIPGKGGGWSAGVAVLARTPVMISLPPAGSDMVHPGRAIAAKVEAPGLRAFLAYSLYLRDGEGMSEENLGILGEVGAHAEAHDGIPFIIGADFQNTPAAVAHMGFADSAGAAIMATGHPRGTCRMKKASTEIDFYVVSKDMARAVRTISTVEGVGTRPHVPVRLQFYPRVTSLKALVLRLPPALPTARIIGPTREPGSWEELTRRAEAMEVKVREQAPLSEIEDQLVDLYSKWADAAEAEIVEATGMNGRTKIGLRGKQPNFVWRSMVPERKPRDDDDGCDAWRWIAAVIWNVRQQFANVMQWKAELQRLRPHEWDSSVDDWSAGEDDEQAIGYDDLADHIDNLYLDTCDALINIHTELADTPDTVSREADKGASEDEHEYRAGDAIKEIWDLVSELLDIVATRRSTVWDRSRSREIAVRICRWDDDSLQTESKIREESEKADRRERAEQKEKWARWVKEKVMSGARNAHTFLKIPEEWRPTCTTGEDGIATASPLRQLDAYVKKYRDCWYDEDDDNEFIADPHGWGKRVAMARPTPGDIREASMSFREATAITYDGIHVYI